MLIEPAVDTDFPTLCALFNDARIDNGSFPNPKIELADFMTQVEGEKILVARIEKNIAGFASVWTKECFLHHLYVSPQYQRQGIGGRLLLECVRAFGLPMALKCVEANIPARNFYEKMGWRAIESADGPEGRYILYMRQF